MAHLHFIREADQQQQRNGGNPDWDVSLVLTTGEVLRGHVRIDKDSGAVVVERRLLNDPETGGQGRLPGRWQQITDQNNGGVDNGRAVHVDPAHIIAVHYSQEVRG